MGLDPATFRDFGLMVRLKNSFKVRTFEDF